MYYSHIAYSEFERCGTKSLPVEDPRDSYRLMDGRARLALKGQWKSNQSDFVTDPRDLLRTASEEPYLLRFACAASQCRLSQCRLAS